LAKKSTKTSQTSACKPSLNSAKLRINRRIKFDVSRFCASETQHKPFNRTDESRNIVSDFPR
jgi:hypothetical protein